MRCRVLRALGYFDVSVRVDDENAAGPKFWPMAPEFKALRAQVPNNQILTPRPVLELLLPKTQVPNCWVPGPSGRILSDAPQSI